MSPAIDKSLLGGFEAGGKEDLGTEGIEVRAEGGIGGGWKGEGWEGAFNILLVILCELEGEC